MFQYLTVDNYNYQNSIMLKLRFCVLAFYSLFLSFSINAYAEYIFESAIGDFDSARCCGGPFISSNSFFGSVFKLNEITIIDGIGGHFHNLPGIPGLPAPFGLEGTIFGALLSVDENNLNIGTLTNLNNVLAFSVFTPNSGFESITPVSITLTPGSYAIVFGSGLFGATGKTLLTVVEQRVSDISYGKIVVVNQYNTPVANPVYGPINRYRMFVTGTTVSAVPEPETYTMILAGLGLMGVVARRRISMSV